MYFTKIGIIKKDKYSKDLIEFTSSTKNNTTIKLIDNFIIKKDGERYSVKFKIKSNEKNKYLLEIDSESKKFVEELKGISEIFIENNNLPILEKDEFYNDELVECNAQKNLDIKDLTGAGDLFAAGYLHGIINNLSIKESLIKGTELSSKIIQKIGARI